MHVPLFIQLMQLIVLHRCCGDGMSCHAHAELRAANKQCVKLPSRVIKACHFRQSRHKFRRVCGWLQPVTYEENRACPKVTGPMTIPERKRTWPQKDSDVYGAGCQSNKYRKDKIQVAARMPPFRRDQNLDKVCSPSSHSGAKCRHVTNICNVAVATPVFPHWVNHGSRS